MGLVGSGMGEVEGAVRGGGGGVGGWEGALRMGGGGRER